MIKIEIDSHNVTEALKKLSSQVENMYPVFDDIWDLLVQNIQEHLGRGETPWGDQFETLQDATKVDRFRGGKKYNKNGTTSVRFYRHMTGDHIPLNDTRKHIYNRIDHVATRQSLEVGWGGEDPIGQVHQFGSDKNNIPARPFLPIHDDAVDLPADWESAILEAITKHLEK